MLRLPLVTVLFVCAFLATSRPASAQCTSAPSVRSPGDVGAYRQWCEACGGTFHYNGSMSSLRCDPGPNWDRKTETASTIPVNSALYQASYQLGYALGRWLFGSRSNPQQELQKRLMMDELRRRQEAADRQRREEHAQFVAGVYNRLAGILKLTGGPTLQLKEIGTGGPTLALKLGDSAGVAGLSGGGAALVPKLGEAAIVPPTQVSAFDPEKMTPQALADVAEMVGKLPPEELQRALAAAQHDATAEEQAQSVGPLEQQADVMRAAAESAGAEDASAQARLGFDTPAEPPPVQLGEVTTPLLLRESDTALSRESIPPHVGEPPPPGTTPPVRDEALDVLKMLFPATPSRWPGATNPDASLNNPLREERLLQAELKWWDDWAVDRAKRPREDSTDDALSVSLERMVDRSTVEGYAPDLLKRFDGEPGFAYELSIKLRAAEDTLRQPYYQAQAEVHKAAVLRLQAEMEKLAEAGTIERLSPLFDQFRRHPEREAIVQAVRDRIAADTRAALEKVLADFAPVIDKEYEAVFNAIRGGKRP